MGLGFSICLEKKNMAETGDNSQRLRLLAQVCLLLVLILGHNSAEGQPSQDTTMLETILNKQDTDHIFSLNRAGWEEYSRKLVYPTGWKMRLAPHDTGTSVMAFDSNTGLGLSIQPLYYGDESQPGGLVVGSYYPPGSLRPFDAESSGDIEQATINDLGAKYSVSASYGKLPKLEGVELTVSRK